MTFGKPIKIIKKVKSKIYLEEKKLGIDKIFLDKIEVKRPTQVKIYYKTIVIRTVES